MATKPAATEADLLQMPDDGWKYELVDGEIRRLSPAGGPHGRIAVELSRLDPAQPRVPGDAVRRRDSVSEGPRCLA